MALGRHWSFFFAGFGAGVAALLFNFLLRLEGLAAFPPEVALSAFISIVPASVEEPMVQQFGELAGELGLLVATGVAAALYGLLLALFDMFVLLKRRPTRLSLLEVLLCFSLIPWLLFGVVLLPLLGGGAFGASLALSRPLGPWTYPATLLIVQGVFALVLLPRVKPLVQGPGVAAEAPVAFGRSRREFIEKSAIGVLAVAAAVVGLTGLGSLVPSQPQSPGTGSPVDLQDAPAIFSDPRLRQLAGSEVTSNEGFYRVAIDIFDPTVDVGSWALKVDGLVNREMKYDLSQVKTMPSTTQYTTLECVSNKIDGNLISNAKWEGVKLSDIFADAGGVQANGKYVVFYSVDGYSVGIPLAKALEPSSILAYRMNDQTLPTKHGYPLRGLIPGLYGMMSAKWINRISVLDSVYQGYWQTRGWTNNAKVNTVAFIVTPQSGESVSISQGGGSVMLAGYAYAGDRGVSKVEVSVDEGKSWAQTQLKKPLSALTWALWAYEWKPQSQGRTQIYVRATDGTGEVQTSAVTDTFPNGATGYAVISVDIGA